MLAPNDNTTGLRSEQAAGPTHPPASSLVSMWARGRRRITPWAYPRLRALAAVRFAIGIFLAGLGAVLLSRAYSGWAVLPLVGAALNLSIAYLDSAAARFAAPRT
jgi:hypothetical protein